MSFTKKVNISICKVSRLNPEMQNYSRNSKLEFVDAGMWIYFDCFEVKRLFVGSWASF